ncbi:hypothetical protein AMTR_s00024p00244470 [Amborella trichopoda]|uniref:Uncharacterized protein n=1 Tax=Amborella trichopoda TaxID=13333 RepID=W1PUD2_AMBTC|nr:hypothetical protein AMTR_s00024p00244470 [Amborella trichopoda]
MTHHDHDTLSTIIERWHVETSTGHLNVDIKEMIPTLEDTWRIRRLKCWAYEHFKLLRLIPKAIRVGQPRSLRWAPPGVWDNAYNFGLPRDISHATQLLREGCNSINWVLADEALDVLKLYDPEDAGEEEYDELELGDEMDDHMLVWLSPRPNEGPSNTQPIPTQVQPKEPIW